MKTHEYHFRVEWGETDTAGIVFSPNFYKWMDQAIHYYFESIGYPLSALVKDEKIGIPVVESKCSFQKPLYFADKVVLHTTIIELRDKTLKFGHEFIKDDEKVAEGYQIRVLASIGGEKVKAIPIPQPMRQAMIESDIIQPSQV